MSTSGDAPRKASPLEAAPWEVPLAPAHPSRMPVYTPAPGFPHQGASPWHPPPPRTDRFAIAALVLGLLGVGLLCWVFGFIALSQIKASGQKGRGMAIGGMAAAGVWFVCSIAVVAVTFPTTSFAPDRDATGALTDDGVVHFSQLRPGDCVNDPGLVTEVTNVDVAPCSQSHYGEIFATFGISASSFPGDAQVVAEAEVGCLGGFEGYIGIPYDESMLGVLYLYPTEASWELGSEGVVCIVHDPAGPLTEPTLQWSER